MGAFIFFSFLAAVILVPRYLRSKERQQLMETIRTAYERGQPIPPEFLASLTRGRGASPSSGEVDALLGSHPRMPSPDRDARRGAVLIAISLGLAALGLALSGTSEMSDAAWPFVGLAAIPGFVGLTFIGLWLIDRRTRA